MYFASLVFLLFSEINNWGINKIMNHKCLYTCINKPLTCYMVHWMSRVDVTTQIVKREPQNTTYVKPLLPLISTSM